MTIREEAMILQQKCVDLRNRICLENRPADSQIFNIMEAESALGRVIKQRGKQE